MLKIGIGNYSRFHYILHMFVYRFLHTVQDGKGLPDGPVVISPDGLFPSLFREGGSDYVVKFFSPNIFFDSCYSAIFSCQLTRDCK